MKGLQVIKVRNTNDDGTPMVVTKEGELFGTPYAVVSFAPIPEPGFAVSKTECKVRTIFAYDEFDAVVGIKTKGEIVKFNTSGEYPVTGDDGTTRMVTTITVVALGNENPISLANSKLKAFNVTVVTDDGVITKYTPRVEKVVAGDDI
jgi:alpha-D-ribose 1-methylphosphonate 5-phosphate C-P lyase